MINRDKKDIHDLKSNPFVYLMIVFGIIIFILDYISIRAGYNQFSVPSGYQVVTNDWGALKSDSPLMKYLLQLIYDKFLLYIVIQVLIFTLIGTGIMLYKKFANKKEVDKALLLAIGFPYGLTWVEFIYINWFLTEDQILISSYTTGFFIVKFIIGAAFALFHITYFLLLRRWLTKPFR